MLDKALAPSAPTTCASSFLAARAYLRFYVGRAMGRSGPGDRVLTGWTPIDQSINGSKHRLLNGSAGRVSSASRMITGRRPSKINSPTSTVRCWRKVAISSRPYSSSSTPNRTTASYLLRSSTGSRPAPPTSAPRIGCASAPPPRPDRARRVDPVSRVTGRCRRPSVWGRWPARATVPQRRGHG
jgi:hypothetical protein